MHKYHIKRTKSGCIQHIFCDECNTSYPSKKNFMKDHIGKPVKLTVNNEN